MQRNKVNAKMKIVRKQRKPKIWASRRSQSYQLAEYVHRPFPVVFPCDASSASIAGRILFIYSVGNWYLLSISHFFFWLTSYHFATSFKGMGHTCEAQTWP